MMMMMQEEAAARKGRILNVAAISRRQMYPESEPGNIGRGGSVRVQMR